MRGAGAFTCKLKLGLHTVCVLFSRKGKKHDSKPEKESDVDTVRVNAALWGLRLKVTDQDLSEYREAHHNLTRVNEQLSTQLYRAEKDSIDMTGYWQKQVEERDDKVWSGLNV